MKHKLFYDENLTSNDPEGSDTILNAGAELTDRA